MCAPRVELEEPVSNAFQPKCLKQEVQTHYSKSRVNMLPETRWFMGETGWHHQPVPCTARKRAPCEQQSDAPSHSKQSDWPSHLKYSPKKQQSNKIKPKDQTQWPSTPSMMYPTFVLVTRIVTPEVNSSFTEKHHSSSQSWPSYHSSTIDFWLCTHWFILSDMFYCYSILNIPKPQCNHAATWQH